MPRDYSHRQPLDIYEGAIFKTKEFGNVIVESYESSCRIKVEFSDGNTKYVAAKELRSGSIKNTFAPYVCGVGFTGEGRHPNQEYLNGKKRNTAAYEVWRGLLRRCYAKEIEVKNPTYVDCTVHVEWHNFDMFADWFYSHPNHDKGYDLDKDLTLFGNKEYGPSTCDFVPREINALFTGGGRRVRGDCPKGVHFCNTKQLFVAQCHRGGKQQEYFGNHKTKESAFAAYKQAKEAYVKVVAERNKDNISEVIYNNLMNYTVHIDD